jgi:O-antigen/teichoic acid export membrane protein
LIDFVILTRFGLVAFGIYTVGAKLYQTLLDLFTASMTEVVFSAFSKIIDAPHRLRHNYFRVVFLASCGAVPLFVLVASLAPEICGILFGSKWSGSERVLMWLSLLGSVQIVLNLNASVIGAGGRPRLNLLITAFRLVCSVAGMAWASTQSVETLAIIFAGTQLLAVPLSYWGLDPASRGGDDGQPDAAQLGLWLDLQRNLSPVDSPDQRAPTAARTAGHAVQLSRLTSLVGRAALPRVSKP